MRRRSSSSAMPPANLIGTIRLGRGKNRSCAVASEFDVIYECCPLVSTVFLFTRLLGNYLRKVEKTQRSVRRPTYSFQRIETFGRGERIRKKKKGKGRKAWIGKLRAGRIKRTTKWGKRDTKEERMRIYTERARRMQNTRVERRRRSVHLRVNWLSSSFSRNHLL